MRLLSIRLIVSLIVGITLVSLSSSYYEALGEKRGLRVNRWWSTLIRVSSCSVQFQIDLM